MNSLFDQCLDSLAYRIMDISSHNFYYYRSLLIVYKCLKWVAHQYYGMSRIKRLCQFAIQVCTSLEEQHQCLSRIVLQICLSDKLSDAVKGEKDQLLLARSVASIKKIDPDQKEEFEILTKAIDIHQELLKSMEKCTTLSQKKVSWGNDKEMLLEMYQSVFEGDTSSEYDLAELSSTKFESDSKKKQNLKGGKNWIALGFQGSDPCTDFRATGSFGLECFYYYCRNYPQKARVLMFESGSNPEPQSNGSSKNNLAGPWYSAALVSIHLSRFILDLINGEGNNARAILRLLYPSREFYDNFSKVLVMDRVFEWHSSMLEAYHAFWLEQVSQKKVKSVLDSESCLKDFKDVMGISV